ncbi:MAG TPA: glycosyltransferase [Arenibaculum sp.]|nr:glycosyltransferase [Arenibaculum sp.]
MTPKATLLRPVPETAAASLHALGSGFLLAVWEANQPGPARRIVPTVNGPEAPRPYTTLTVRTNWGGQRTLTLLRRTGPTGMPSAVRFHDDDDGHLLAEAQASGALPDVDAGLLLGGLDSPARLRVVRLFLDFARSAQALKADAAFVAVCRRLILELSPRPSAVVARARLTDGLLLCEGTLSGGFGDILSTIVLTTDAMGGAPFAPQAGTGTDRQGRVALHLVVDRALCGPDNLLVLVGRNGLACRTLLPAGAALPQLLQHLGHRKACPLPLRQYLSRCLAQRGKTDRAAASALDELQVLLPLPKRQLADPERPIGAALDLAVPTGDGGLFLSGWMHDPHGLSTGLRVLTAFGDERRLDHLPHRFPREDVAALYKTGPGDRSGFAAFLPGSPEPAPALQVHAEMNLGSGGKVDLVPPPRPRSAVDARAAVLGSIPPAFLTPEILRTVIAPAVAPLHAAHMASRGTPARFVFGRLPEHPAVSVVVPLYRNLEFLRFQMAAFATDPAMAEAELIFVLDSPEQQTELDHFLSGLHGLYGVPFVLLVHDANYGYSAANNTGAAAARGEFVLFLNSDVVPDRPGWLPELASFLLERPGTGAVGPKLLFDDDSLQHAGLYFDRDVRGRWYNHHYFKGMPRDFAPATLARSVPGVTGACMLMWRSVFEDVGGFCEDYVIGDFEDSDLCLRIRQAGHDIRYVPSVELYHLERQSISRHAGYTRGVASEYNCWLHDGRWSDLMAELMARDWSPAAPRAAPDTGHDRHSPNADRSPR